MKKIILISTLFVTVFTQAQIDTTLLKRSNVKANDQLLNMDAVYNRPFLTYGKVPVSLGGYAEANWQNLGTEGVSEGHQFQMRRMTLFVSSTIGKKVKFLSEIEFENGGREIAIEFASIDVEFHPLLNLRGGIIMNPIGAFNQNHDGPKWEFTERPLSATQMLPATWSNAGFGLYGKYYMNDWLFGYEAYLSSGFDNSIINNGENRTHLPSAKENALRLEETTSGRALFTGKLAIKNAKIGEIGLSYMGGAYNKFEEDGLAIDEKRRLDIVAVDINTTIKRTGTTFTGEYAWVFVDVPNTYSQQFGNKQEGGFLDIVQPIIQNSILGWRDAVLNLAFRLEYVDFNVGKFKETGDSIGDNVWSIVPAISFRPTPQSVFRLNYRYQMQQDILGNPAEKTAGLSVGFSTYF